MEQEGGPRLVAILSAANAAEAPVLACRMYSSAQTTRLVPARIAPASTVAMAGLLAVGGLSRVILKENVMAGVLVLVVLVLLIVFLANRV